MIIQQSAAFFYYHRWLVLMRTWVNIVTFCCSGRRIQEVRHHRRLTAQSSHPRRFMATKSSSSCQVRWTQELSFSLGIIFELTLVRAKQMEADALLHFPQRNLDEEEKLRLLRSQPPFRGRPLAFSLIPHLRNARPTTAMSVLGHFPSRASR